MYVTLGGDASKTVEIVSPLWRTILHIVRYCSRSVVFPNHLSSQKRIFDPSLIENDLKRNVTSLPWDHPKNASHQVSKRPETRHMSQHIFSGEFAIQALQ
jgi:hypothetical protein